MPPSQQPFGPALLPVLYQPRLNHDVKSFGKNPGFRKGDCTYGDSRRGITKDIGPPHRFPQPFYRSTSFSP